jgi:uncharacterized protein YegP (UPF0339 family)
MKLKVTLGIAMLFIKATIFAQSIEYTNIFKFKSRNSGAIVENNNVSGYYTFHATEKVDRKNMAYSINFLDNNLNKATDFEIVRDKKSYLVDAVYNQNSFMLCFYQKKTLEFVTYDRSGKQLGSHMIEDIPKTELANIVKSMQSEDNENSSIFPIGNQGFVRSTFTKNDRDGYEIQAYNNDMSSKWIFGSNPESELLEYSDILYSSENYVGITVIKRKTKLTKKFDTDFILIDAKTGKVLCNTPMRDVTDGELSLLNIFVDDSNGETFLTGEYYLPKDEVMKDKSIGMYVKKVRTDGSEIIFKKFAWGKEIANFKQVNLSDDDKDKDKGTNQIWFHKFVKGKNGHIYAIGEQYRKQASAAGIAMNVLNGGGGSGVSNIEIKIANLVLVDFDENMEMVDYKIIPKKTRRVMLAEDYGLTSPQALATWLVAGGWFDYDFMSYDNVKDQFQMVYRDADRKEEKDSKGKSDVMIGVISIDKTGNKTTNRIPVNTDARYIWYRPAKAGYILIGEYYRKDKRVTYRLEKLSN